MLEQVEKAFKDLLASLQLAKLYGIQHKIFRDSVDKAYLSLAKALEGRSELVIGIIGEELAFEKEILFGLSKAIGPAVGYLKNLGIERISFGSNVQKDELEKFIEFLASKKDTAIDQQGLDFGSLGIRNIVIGKLTVLGKDKVDELGIKAVDYMNIYGSAADMAHKSFSSMLEGEALDALAVKLALNNILENLAVYHNEFFKIVALRRHDPQTHIHLINVATIAMYFASRLGFSKADILDIGMSGLFHDIGKLYISHGILTKTDKLTNEEFAKIKSHTIFGAEILLEHIESLGILPAVVSFEHHLKYDMTGYPRVNYSRRPHIASLIVSICDVYDALFSRRTYKEDYSPENVYNIMIKDKNTAFEPRLVERFFKIMGVWYIGCVVSLSDGRIAVVREQNEDDIRRPKVEVVFPKDRKEFIDLKENSSLEIKRSLNPWTEARDYVS
ncbi:MAG: HD domain-containing protein [Candidatus Omnitrophota bacterium]|jgi:putative nucleotidyltransferase with HDIG domain|nr:MAG: HD domain-containing protein [Candidatus Omnitrophota bacterium]